MKSNPIPEIAFLRSEVERTYGRGIHTSTDFESLSVIIERDTGEFVSASTLKRIWGYVSSHPVPRISTLDTLSRYIGKGSFDDLRQFLQDNASNPSSFFTSKFVSADTLSPEDEVTIGWNPNRLVILTYLGENRFRVRSSENSKLKAGDEFSVSQFMLGQPLIIDRIFRDGEFTPSYAAGRKQGLNQLEINRKGL
jgi:hypothetical protein